MFGSPAAGGAARGQFYMVCLQPLLVHVFHASQSLMARVALAYCGVAVIPSLVVGLLAGRLSSRSIILLGMGLKASRVLSCVPRQ